MVADRTTIQEPDVEKKVQAKTKAPAKKKKGSNAPAYTPGEVEKHLDIIFRLIARITGREYIYSPKDYTQEAAGLVRLAEKYGIIAAALVVFDPIIVISGLVTKFMNMTPTEATQAKRAAKKNTAAKTPASQPDQSGEFYPSIVNS